MKELGTTVSRRQFVTGLAAAAGGISRIEAVQSQRRRTGAQATGLQISVFSKHFQWLDFTAMGAAAARLGFDGVDLTVRPGGHVPPEQVESQLPQAVNAMQDAGLNVPVITTAITDAEDPATERILATAAELGIRYYRLGYYRYYRSTGILETLSQVRAKLEALVKLNEKYGICGDYQNHAGSDYFGASIWDLWNAIENLDPKWIGCQFDLRHASVEGALSWPVDFRLISSRTHTLVAKDFKWVLADGQWEIEDCPLGEGIADFRAFFALLRQSGFTGPITLHLEYPLGGADAGAPELTIESEVVLEAMRKDLTTLRNWLRAARL